VWYSEGVYDAVKEILRCNKVDVQYSIIGLRGQICELNWLVYLGCNGYFGPGLVLSFLLLCVWHVDCRWQDFCLLNFDC